VIVTDPILVQSLRLLVSSIACALTE
jgi:hypothetical protein